MALPTIRVLSLFAGGGGLDEGFAGAFPTARTVCYVERELSGAAALVRRMAQGELDEAPIWSDIRTFDGRAWRGAVDCVLAGWPCPPVSVAGNRRGVEDERWLWPDVHRLVDETGAWLVALENVPGLVSAHREFGDVLGSLADLRFDAEWLRLPASAVGSSQERQRWFCLAHSDERRFEFERLSHATGLGCASGNEPDGCGEALADVDGCGLRQDDRAAHPRQSDAAGGGEVEIDDGRPSEQGRSTGPAEAAGWRPCHGPSGSSGLLDDAERAEWRPNGLGRSGDLEGREPGGEADGRAGVASALLDDADAHSSGRIFAPGPGERDEWRAIIAADPLAIPAHSDRHIWETALQAARTAGYPAPDATWPGGRAAQRMVRRVAHGLAARFDRDRRARLRILGNGVVPQQAAAAFRELARRLGL